MKRKRYSVEQIVAAVKQHELGTSAADISRRLSIAEQTFSRWKKHYGGSEPAEARELKQLRNENRKPTRLTRHFATKSKADTVNSVPIANQPCQASSRNDLRPSACVTMALTIQN